MTHHPTLENNQIKANPSPLSTFIVYLSFILIIPIFIYLYNRNNIIREKEQIEENISAIDVQLKRRYDMLTKLVESTKQYMKYEKETLEKIVSLRQAINKYTPNDFEKINNQISDQFSKINVLLERYPDLKANNSVIQLQKGIVDCEDNIAASRRFYNAVVRSFNSKFKTWPSNIIVSQLGYTSYLYFEASSTDRQDVKIDFTF